ncbi:hypothetical protein [Aeromicrobium sp.]|uniref:hypothetical protein n=1 Tax=Aeromicrobium sp. TaxID=1871063 RepID=UPI0019BE37F1|nr:hypothetical protein [Aeromicrobium sp.]MBC7632321.1 hypothetical protein [Aeromicrobium sp.]
MALIAAAAVLLILVVVVVGQIAGPDDVNPSAAPAPSAGPSATPLSSAASPTPSVGATATDKPIKRPAVKTLGIGATAKFNRGTTARLVKITRVNGKAVLPGEIAGPAIAVQVSVYAGERVSFDQTVVNAYSGARDTPAIQLSTGTKPLTGSLARSRTTTGTYVFAVPDKDLDDVTIEFDFALQEPVTLFTGAVR